MATVGQLEVSANVSGGPSGARTFTSSIPITAGVDATQVVALSSGANTITPPTGATVCVIWGQNATVPAPNPASTVTLIVKGVTGDTGISISSTYPFVWPVGTLPATFVLTASGSATVEVWWA